MINDWPFTVKLKRSRNAKKLSLTVDTTDGCAKLVLPQNASLEEGQDFIKRESKWILEEISKLGISHGLEFLKFDPQDEEQIQIFLVVMPIQIELRGSFHQLAQFLGDLARIGRIVTVSDLMITTDSNDFSDAKRNAALNATAKILVYRYLPGG